MEVIFAVGVATVGLLGVISLLPLAANHVRHTVRTDRAAILGNSAVDEFDLRGMRRPDMYAAWNSNLSPPRFMPLASFGYPANQAFCIDPRFLMTNRAALPSNPSGALFPYYGPNYPVAGLNIPRMVRLHVTAAPGLAQLMSAAQVNEIFLSQDDLAIEFPSDDTIASYVRGFNPGKDRKWGIADVDDNNNGVIDEVAEAGAAGSDDEVLKRLSNGKYSWIATLVPKLDTEIPLPATPPNPPPAPIIRLRDEYTLSVLVFHNRDGALAMDEENEQVFNVTGMPGGGFGGGDVLLEAVDPSIQPTDDREVLDIAEGNWILLSSRSTAGPVHRWYRVASADWEPRQRPSLMPYNSGNPVWTRQVTLAGPDWTRPEWTNPSHKLFSFTQATLVKGVVAVYEKTIRLETSSLWSNINQK